MFVILASWFVLGAWYGVGYCLLTDWHWDIKRQLGEVNLPNSYIEYCLARFTGYNVAGELLDYCVFSIGILLFACSVWVNRPAKKRPTRCTPP
jgi:hypothetical protein